MNSTKGYCQCGCGQLTALETKSNSRLGIAKGMPRKFLPGHNRRGKQMREDLTGRRFGKLVVLEIGEFKHKWRVRWLCKCDCGNTTEVDAWNLKAGLTTSCKCNHKAAMTSIFRTHGQSKSSVYRIWGLIIDRCENPKNPAYNRYGGRGITICEEWRNSFEQFANDIGPRPSKVHSVERIDNDLGYSPINCKWATRSEQGANTSKSVLIEFDGERLCLSEWSRRTGIKSGTIVRRLRSGWSVERSLRQKPRSPKEITKRPRPDNNKSQWPEYWAWRGMIRRCCNPSDTAYKNYGQRGITVCKEWAESFDLFLNDMGIKPDDSMTLDRIDNNKGYYKDNCRWATKAYQRSNQRPRGAMNLSRQVFRSS